MTRTHRLAAFVTLLLTGAPAAAAAQGSTAPYTQGSVWTMTFVRVKPGRGDDWLNDFRATTRRMLEEGKRQGLVVSYKVISAPAATGGDWNFMVMVEYRNMAALDQTDEKFRAINAKLIGPPEAQRSVAEKRGELREVIGAKLGRELILRDTSVTAQAPRP
jgi:DNA-binding Lrp family transcriptional regulator